jgi:hypothetical protein
MKNQRLVLPLALLAPALVAQEHTVAIKPAKDTPIRYTVEASSKVETEQKMLRNGEEMGGGRGGGQGRAAPAGPVSAQQKLVFVDAGSWRLYETAEATVTRPGWDGDTSEQKVTGELQGKKLSLSGEPAVVGEGDKTTPIAANAVRGLPRKIDFSSLAPNKPLAVNATYEIGAGFKDAIASLAHPIRAARPEGGEGGGRRARGEGGEGGGRRARGEGDEGGGGEGRGQRERGQRGQGRGMGPMGGADNPALTIMTSEAAQPKLTGKLVKVEDNLATIEITGEVTGKGDPQKLGLGGGAGMFRGRRGGEGEEPPAPTVNEGNVKVAVNGTLVVDVSTNSLHSLSLGGKLESKAHTEMTREFQGEEMEIVSDRSQKGDFSVKVAAAPAK